MKIWEDLILLNKMGRIKPITPEEVIKHKEETIPDFVFEAFNHMIKETFKSGSARVLQKDVVGYIVKNNDNVSSEKIYKNGWLDIEKIYRKHGWVVTYDKPAYNETYDAYFVFDKK